jgi:hypothetical protein
MPVCGLAEWCMTLASVGPGIALAGGVAISLHQRERGKRGTVTLRGSRSGIAVDDSNLLYQGWFWVDEDEKWHYLYRTALGEASLGSPYKGACKM